MWKRASSKVILGLPAPAKMIPGTTKDCKCHDLEVESAASCTAPSSEKKQRKEPYKARYKSTLGPELEKGVIVALEELVTSDKLTLLEVSEALTYLAKSSWAARFFVDANKERRLSMIKNAQK